ncbi:hypothetical protein EJ08DRAFT_351683 [Tothia fuscella]|uniref:Uncharacterized protein n=1 Tax=Tothia fuscella TaxID=1048955 RepID=A0A9P4NM94_9PEZI|nr:hypothetical protein EJ08DRAFT_351683 [Tothia fuscella]
MVLKRKRSSAELETSPSSTSSFLSSPSSRTSTSPTPNPQQFSGHVEAPISSFNNSMWSFQHKDCLDVRLNARTQKRLRNRDDEGKIEQSTISKLFDAQRQYPNAAPVLSQEQPSVAHPFAQKSTLHAFWQLPQPPPQGSHAMVLNSHENLRCEDCERALPTSDVMDVGMMMLDDGGCACHSCGRKVCDFCAVSLGTRVCLNCVDVDRQ